MRGGMLTVALAGLVYAGPARAQTETSTDVDTTLEDLEFLELEALDAELEEVVVEGTRITPSASAAIVRSRDLLLRPRRRPADLLEVTPGLKVVQHAGGGKANQYFLRGFDADHGTDLRLTVDGVPVNMVSHGHGQGYADLHFVIPELVDRLEIKKGPYWASLGDFATAGAIDLVMKEKVDKSSVTLSGGSFDTFRGLVATSPELGPVGTLLAAEIHSSNGPFENDEDLKRFNVFARGKVPLLGGHLKLTGLGYGASWNASGQIPNREVAAGRLNRFGFIDPTEGGSSRRFTGTAQYDRVSAEHAVSARAYLSHYRFNLFSNFTFFSRDADNGDMIEQLDDRMMVGGDVRYTHFGNIGSVELETTVGAETRTDLIDNGLFYDRARERLDTVVDANIRETSLSLYASEEIAWTRWLRTTFGVRGDFFDFDVEDRLGSGSGTEQAFLVSPKASLVVSPLKRTSFFVNFGLGFHSNDARGVILSEGAVTPLTRALGSEVGVRTRLFDRLDFATAFFLLDLDSEIVWIGDEGTTEASGATRRMGVEAEARLKLWSWLYADVDVTLTRARFVDAGPDEDQIPLAPRLTVGGGLSAIHPIGVYGRLALVHIGDRPATEDGFIRAEAVTKADLSLGYRNDTFDVSLNVQNLLNSDLREAQFATTSRLAGETAASCSEGTRAVTDGGSFAGCEDLHFTPGPPLSAQLAFSLFF